MSKYYKADEVEKLLSCGCAYAIRDLPTIDIVHCKDCKYYVSDGGAMMGCELTHTYRFDEYFCSDGERIEE